MICFIRNRDNYTLRKRLHYFSAFTGKALTALIAVLCIASLCHGQDAGTASDSGEEETAISPLSIGEKVPAEFWTREHLFYIDGDTVRKNLEEYKGKLLVLDFWATWCAICLGQMKEVEAIFDKYPKETRLLMLNNLATRDTYTTLWERQKKLAEVTFKDQFESIIEDEYIGTLFPVRSYPQYVWIGPFGNIIAMTSALSATEGHLTGIVEEFKKLPWLTFD